MRCRKLIDFEVDVCDNQPTGNLFDSESERRNELRMRLVGIHDTRPLTKLTVGRYSINLYLRIYNVLNMSLRDVILNYLTT